MPAELIDKDWPAIRHAYEHTDEPVDDICARFAIGTGTLRDRMRRWKWTRRRPAIPPEGPPAPLLPVEAPPLAAPAAPLPAPAARLPAPAVDSAQIARSLQGALARVLATMNATLATLGESAHPREIERAGRTLAALTRTLHELNALLPQYRAAAADNDRGPQDDEEFARELVRRIDAVVAARYTAPDAEDTRAATAEISVHS